MSKPSQTRDGASRAALIICGVLAVLILGGGIVIARSAGYLRPKQKLAIVTWNQDPFWDLVLMGAKDAADERNVELTVIRSQPDEKTQSQHIRDLLAQGVDGIAISPNNPDAQAALLNEAASKTVLITFDSDAPKTNRKGFIGTDDYAAGQVAAEEVRTALPDGGEVIVSVGSVDMVNGRNRRQGLIDDLLDRPFKRDRAADPVDGVLKGTKYSIVATITDGGDSAQSTSRLVDSIKSHPNARCIVGLFSYSGHAAVKAIEQSGKAGQIKVIGFDETDDTQADMEAGKITSSILQDQYRCGYETIRILSDAAKGMIEQHGPTDAQLTHLPIWVMQASDILEFRESKRIHTPGTKPAT